MEFSNLAVPSVYLLIFFLSYTSQFLFLWLEPEPLTKSQIIKFNFLLICLLISYTRSCFVDPGTIPGEKEDSEKEIVNGKASGGKQRKWCRKCNAAKPPRAHHCRECKRCIPKMDHHCPWTSNCVSHTTFPHFLRFLFYAVLALAYLATFLWTRISHLWETRNMPAYLGPSMPQLAHLFMLTISDLFMLFALSILLVRNIWCLAVNTTTIEGWEIERHRTLVRRARYFGGVLEGPDGVMVPIKKQEFPYDIGIFRNIRQGMGSANPINWFNPLSATPPIETGLVFETNGFEDAGTSWPPPDPDRMQRNAFPKEMAGNPEEAFTYRDAGLNEKEHLAAFRKRQDEDVVRRRKPFLQRIEEQKAAQERQQFDMDEDDGEGFGSEEELSDERSEKRHAKAGEESGEKSGEEAWRNSEGERLRDFGVDEDVEFYDEEDDIPLSELLARKRAAAASAST